MLSGYLIVKERIEAKYSVLNIQIDKNVKKLWRPSFTNYLHFRVESSKSSAFSRKKREGMHNFYQKSLNDHNLLLCVKHQELLFRNQVSWF